MQQELWRQAADVTAAGRAVTPAPLHPWLEACAVVAVAAGCVDGSGAKAGEGLATADAAHHLVAACAGGLGRGQDQGTRQAAAGVQVCDGPGGLQVVSKLGQGLIARDDGLGWGWGWGLHSAGLAFGDAQAQPYHLVCWVWLEVGVCVTNSLPLQARHCLSPCTRALHPDAFQGPLTVVEGHLDWCEDVAATGALATTMRGNHVQGGEAKGANDHMALCFTGWVVADAFNAQAPAHCSPGRGSACGPGNALQS